MTQKPWRELAIPHEDVMKGTFQQAEFAADLCRVHEKTAVPEYQDPVLFFRRTFITEGMTVLLESVVKRLSGRGGDPVIQLQTAFGGGKTHTMLAVYHLVTAEVPSREMQGVPSILDRAGVTDLPKVRVAVLDGINLAPNVPRQRGDLTIRTLWGDLAWQLGGDEGYRLLQEADHSGTSPGKEILAQLLSRYAPCVILIDELVSYIRQFSPGATLSGGTYDSNLSFIQALTEALKAVPNAVLLVSLPESDREAGGQRGNDVLQTLEYYFGRVQALWRPVSTEESFEIVRRRLFSEISDVHAVESVCRSFADLYIEQAADFPIEAREAPYYDRLRRAYPIHPEVFDRLYEDWSTLETFQRTRGVLKLMAMVIHRLWMGGNNDLLILPGSFPLSDAEVRSVIQNPLPQGWDPVLERDIDGDRSEVATIETKETRFGSLQACRRVARTIFLGSAPTTSSQQVRGVETERILLGCVQPGQLPSLFRDALRRLTDRLHYLNNSNNRYWFDTRPNLRREMEERKRRFQDPVHLAPLLRDRLRKMLDSGFFGGIHVFTKNADVPDDGALRLVVLPFDDALNTGSPQFAYEQTALFLNYRGDQPRQKQNRLVFLLADHGSVSNITEQLQTILAWQSIIDDIEELRINLDQYQTRQARKNLEEAQSYLDRTIRETYKWLVVPGQEASPEKGVGEIRWEPFALSTNSSHLTKEIERVLVENELVISEWSPVHLKKILTTWFWKPNVPDVLALDICQKMTSYLYFPRLLSEQVFRSAIEKGADSPDFFGLALGKEQNQYIGFSFHRPFSVNLDHSLLLINPDLALKVEEEKKKAEKSPRPEEQSNDPIPVQKPGSAGEPQFPTYPQPTSQKKLFYASIDLDPRGPKASFAQIVEEVLNHFNLKPDASVTLSLEIHAETSKQFDEGFQRTIKENCNVLKFKSAEFED